MAESRLLNRFVPRDVRRIVRDAAIRNVLRGRETGVFRDATGRLVRSGARQADLRRAAVAAGE